MPEIIEEPIEAPIEEAFKPISVGVLVEKVDQSPIILDNKDYALIQVLNKLADTIELLRIAIQTK